jgi:hypothetical protein
MDKMRRKVYDLENIRVVITDLIDQRDSRKIDDTEFAEEVTYFFEINDYLLD